MLLVSVCFPPGAGWRVGGVEQKSHFPRVMGYAGGQWSCGACRGPGLRPSWALRLQVSGWLLSAALLLGQGCHLLAPLPAAFWVDPQRALCRLSLEGSWTGELHACLRLVPPGRWMEWIPSCDWLWCDCSCFSFLLSYFWGILSLAWVSSVSQIMPRNMSGQVPCSRDWKIATRNRRSRFFCKKYGFIFIYLLMAVLGLYCCRLAFFLVAAGRGQLLLSSCAAWSVLAMAAAVEHGLLWARASAVAAHGL